MPDLPLERTARLKLEEERLRALPSFMFELQSFDNNGIASGVMRYDERGIPITIRYYLDFPFMRPTLWTEDEDVKTYRHVNRAGEICTLRYQPDEWEPDNMTAADLVRRAWKLIANEGVLDDEEDDQLPISLDFQLGAKSPLLIVPEGASPGEAKHGTTALQRSKTFVEGLALITLKHERGSVIWSQTQDEQLDGRYTMDGKLTGAPWFVATSSPPRTLESLEDLKSLLPAGVPRTHFDGLSKGLKIRQSRQSFILVHFRDETGPRWVLVSVEVTRTHNGRITSKASYLPSFTIGMDAFFGRIDGLVDRERLRESRVVVIGQGAIGSSVTHLLNQCGVGNIFGFDGDDVEPGNPVRGHLPFTHMGLPKAQSLDVSLTQHLPSSKYVAVPFATSTMEGQRELAEVLKQGVDLIIIAVGNHNTSRMIDAIVAPFKVPRIHTWTTRGAAAGVVFGIQPGKDLPDYYLYDKLVRAGQVPYLPEVPESEIPNVSERGCSAPVLPGTPLDIGSVALHAARTAINLLHGEEVPTYQVWTQADQNWEDMPLTVPNMLGLEVMEPLPKVKQVVLAYAMRLAIEEEIRASPKRETGGVFMGQVVKEELRLEYASGPGLQAKRTRNRLMLDVRYAQGCINAVRRLTNNRLRYFGEWHSHLGGDLLPSQDDIRALQRLALSEAANISFPVIILTMLKQDGSLLAKAFTLTHGLVTELPVILEGFTPRTFTAESLGISYS